MDQFLSGISSSVALNGGEITLAQLPSGPVMRMGDRVFS
jgi:hypothetical protein